PALASFRGGFRTWQGHSSPCGPAGQKCPAHEGTPQHEAGASGPRRTRGPFAASLYWKCRHKPLREQKLTQDPCMARYSSSAPPKPEVPPARLTRQTLREAAGLFGYLWPYRFRFAAALAALFLSSLLALALPYLAGSLIDGALTARGEQPLSGRWHPDINTTALILLAV